MKSLLELGCGFFLVMGLTACLKNEVVEPKNMAGVSIYHSSPDAPDVNIIIDDEVITSQAFRYKNYSSLIEISEGKHRMRFNRFSDGGSLIDSTLTFDTNKSYSLFMLNALAKIEVQLIDDASKFPASGNGALRFINTSPDATMVDVRLIGETTSLFNGISFKQPTAFQDVTANTYSIEVKEQGANGRKMTLSNVQIAEGKFYSLLIEGFDTLPAGNTNIFTARIIAH